MRFVAIAGAMAAGLIAGSAWGQAAVPAPAGQAATSNAPVVAAGDADRHKRAGEIMRQMLTPESVAIMEGPPSSTKFGSEFPKLAYEHAYVSLWTRPELSLKERSILTIGILIGTGNERELRSHIRAGLKNGLTVKQIEEIIYHATAYAGFPAASSALAIAADVVQQQQK